MAIMKKIGLILVGLVVVFVGVGLMLPTQINVERSIVIQSAPAEIHQYVGDLQKWEQWTPWQKEDPTLVITLGDITAGVGASQSWQGDSGKGSLKIVSSSPDTGITYDLYFDGDQHKSDCVMRYDEIQAIGNTDLPGDTAINTLTKRTNVTWSMSGDMSIPVVGGYLALMMDGMAGGMLEQGLVSLKKVVEGK